MTPSWTLFVAGEPKTTQTGSVVRSRDGRAFPVRRHTEWMNRIALAAQASRPPQLYEGPVGVQLVFYRTRPKSMPSRVAWPIQRPDLDNMSKGLTDALEGIVYRTDAQIVWRQEIKQFGERPGVQIVVAPAGPAPDHEPAA